MHLRWPRVLTPTYLSQVLLNQKSPLKALQIFNEAKSKYPNYRHNGPVYATMINILGNSGRIADMKEVINQMKEDSCECRDTMFANVIKTYAKAGLLNEAISLFRSLHEFNCVNWTESFNILLKIMVKESDLETVHQLFLENCDKWEVKTRTYSMNLLIDAMCQRNRSDLALHVFQEMSCQSCYPTRDTYRILMRGLCEDGRLNEAIHLLYSMFWRISQKGGGGDIVIYRILLDTLCDYGQVEEAAEILRKILRKGLKAPKRHCKQLDLSECRNGRDKERAKSLINDALIRGGIPSSSSYSAMAVDLYSEGKINDANKVLKEMHHSGFRPSVLLYETKMAALCREGRINEAEEVIAQDMMEANCVPSVSSYNTLLKGLCADKRSSLAVGYLEKMSRQVGCVPNKETYAILVDGLCHDGRYVEASQVLEQMLANSYWPVADTYNTLIRGLLLIGRPYEAIMWLEEMVSQDIIPEFSTWVSLVSSVTSDAVVNEVSFEMNRSLLS